MIIQTGQRTDIPAFFADWFYERIKEGYVCVRNPMNPHQVSKIPVTRELTDCIVFWTKNPEPMLKRLDELKGYDYYFQYTMNGYGNDVEPHIPPLEKRMETFRMLSERIGKEKVIWRYDPILFSNTYTWEGHLKEIEYIAQNIGEYTEKCVFSFVDIYQSKNLKNIRHLGNRNLSESEMEQFLTELVKIAGKYNLKLATCAEAVDLERFGIGHNSCIDGNLISRITGWELKTKPDGQREHCQCVKCEEIGTYDTCPHGCVYCYANFRPEHVREKLKKYDVHSPILCDSIDPENDKVTERPVKSLKLRRIEPNSDDSSEQLALF